MDRCAVFVDAGYVFAEGGKLCEGTPSRSAPLERERHRRGTHRESTGGQWRSCASNLLVRRREEWRSNRRAADRRRASAQDMGVRLGLVGIAPAGKTFNQSRELVHEADTTTVLTASVLRPF